MSGIVRVLNLSSNEERFYTCTPAQAVIAAYAQSRNDNNTWDYAKRYSRLLTIGGRGLTISCGDYCALFTSKEEPTP